MSWYEPTVLVTEAEMISSLAFMENKKTDKKHSAAITHTKKCQINTHIYSSEAELNSMSVVAGFGVFHPKIQYGGFT